MVEHGVEQLAVARVGKRAEQIAVAHIAGGEAVAVGGNVLQESLQHCVTVLSCDAEKQRQGVGSLTARGVAQRVGTVEVAVEFINHILATGGKPLAVVLVTHHLRSLLHELQTVDVVTGGNQRHGSVVGEARRFVRVEIVPVAQPVAHDTVVRTGGEVVDVAHHRLVVVAYHRVVAVHLVVLERRYDEGSRPFGRVVEEIAERHVLRSRCRHHAVRALRVGDVADNLWQIGCHVVVVEQRRTAQMVLLQPS